MSSLPSQAIYVHWPWCQSKCPYCDFNSHVGMDMAMTDYRDLILRDLTHAAGQFDQGPVHSVFFGGGTPSLMEPFVVGSILESIDQHFGLMPGAEITLEANPSSVENAKMQGICRGWHQQVFLGRSVTS
jgi:Coproporphyrinogen III oxidase and related Fe-S oxidoreductases